MGGLYRRTGTNTAVQLSAFGTTTPPANWRTDLLSATNSDPRRIIVVGGSSAYGAASFGATPPKWRNAYPGILRAALETDYGDAGSGIVPANSVIRTGTGLTNGWDPRWSYSGTITDEQLGWHKQSCFTLSSGASATFTRAASSFRVYLLNATGGTCQVFIDGNLAGTIRADVAGPTPSLSPIATAKANHLVTDVPAGAYGNHTLTVTATSGPVRILQVEAKTGLGRFIVDNPSFSGKALSTLGLSSSNNDETNGMYGLPIVDLALAQGRGVAILALGTNDWQAGTSVATASSYLSTLVDRVRAVSGWTPIIYTQPQPSPTLKNANGPAWVEYVNLYQERAATLGVPILDHWRLWSGDSITDEQAIYDAGNALGMYADTLHPSDKGAATIATGGYGSTASVRAYLGI